MVDKILESRFIRREATGAEKKAIRPDLLRLQRVLLSTEITVKELNKFTPTDFGNPRSQDVLRIAPGLFDRMDNLNRSLNRTLSRIKSRIPDYQENVFDIIPPGTQAKLRPVYNWKDNKREILIQSIQERLDAMRRRVLPSSKLFQKEFVELVFRNVGITFGDDLKPSNVALLEQVKNLMLYNEFDYQENPYFIGFYFRDDEDFKWTDESIKKYFDECKRKIHAATLEEFGRGRKDTGRRPFWLRRGDIKKHGQRVIGDRYLFSEGQKLETFIAYSILEGELLLGNYNFIKRDKSRMRGIMPKLASKNVVEGYLTGWATEHFLSLYDDKKTTLGTEDAIESCHIHSIPDAKKAYNVERIVPDSARMLELLVSEGKIIRVQDEDRDDLYQRVQKLRRRDVSLNPDFY